MIVEFTCQFYKNFWNVLSNLYTLAWCDYCQYSDPQLTHSDKKLSAIIQSIGIKKKQL